MYKKEIDFLAEQSVDLDKMIASQIQKAESLCDQYWDEWQAKKQGKGFGRLTPRVKRQNNNYAIIWEVSEPHKSGKGIYRRHLSKGRKPNYPQGLLINNSADWEVSIVLKYEEKLSRVRFALLKLNNVNKIIKQAIRDLQGT